MKRFLSALSFCLLATTSFGAVFAPRTIKNVPDAQDSLRRLVSPKFYQSLLISPVDGWVTVRGFLAGNHLTNVRIVHTDVDAEFNNLALELAKNLQIQGYRPTGTGVWTTPVLVHVAVYGIADGKLAVSFANLDNTGGTQFRYYGSAWMGVQKNDKSWVTIEPKVVSPYEHRGPRSYTLTLIQPGYLKNSTPRAVGYPVQSAR